MSRKQSPFLAKIEALHELKMKNQRLFTMQQCEDVMMLALNEVFSAGPEMTERFRMAYYEIFLEYAEMVHEDFKADKSIVYTKTKVDDRLREIRGKYYVPREKRYYMMREPD